MSAPPTASTVALYMEQLVNSQPWLYQEMVVYDLANRFGQQFIYQNANGNLAISKDVLKEFNRLTAQTVVWARTSRYWRLRRPSDGPGRMVQV